ncbi:GFA family protein [Massilia solisilvae]|uniref:GFA family protein n=1 Tax=Massilia solisilvae TaxID=1811225 RepID=A0ABT2BFE6_9BURK|nr:GFA family protein [Massilia solisilvae]MCS0607132.1 GFA family protein [Massilia solisilvae]
MKTYHGSCHCGEVRFTAAIDLGLGTIKCNCSICTKMRWWAAVVAPEAFRLSSTEQLGEYRFLTRRDGHYFCSRCGIHTHSTGESARMGQFVAVAVACLDDATPEELITAPVRWLDGRNDVWEAPPAETRHL